MLLSLLLCVAPVLEGGPRARADVIGSAIGDFGSRFVIKAVVTGADEDRPGALAFYDGRSGRSRDSSVGTFSLDVLEGATSRLRTGRHVTFDVHGWSETITDGALTATLRASTLARNVYLVRLTLAGVTAPLTITGRAGGTVATGATYDTGLVTIDDADRPAFGFILGARPGTPMLGGASGATYSATAALTVSGNGSTDFLLAFDETPAAARTVLAMAPAEAPAIDWTMGLSKPHSTDARYLAAQQPALAALRMNEVRDPSGKLLGGAPAKTHYHEVWLWDSAFQALGVSEWSVPDAVAQLDGVYRGQIADAGHPDHGMIYNHVDEAGNTVLLGVSGFTDEYSQAPALGFTIRELYDRSARDDAAKAALQRSFDAALPFIDWWFRRRDRDGNGLAEYNGGWESGLDNSPRFTELWGDTTARFPADEADPRPKLNCVDANAWLYLYLIELANSADRLGRSDGAQLRERANALAAKIEDPTNGFWDDTRGLYADFVFAAGKRRLQATVTPMALWPLFVGLTHDEARARRVIEGQLLDPAKFWGPFGVPTVAFDDPSFSSGDYWRGPVWMNTTYAMLIALFRYGYEAEAEQLKTRMLELGASDHGLWEYYDSKTGAGLNVYQLGWSGAFYLEVLRDRHQAEGFAIGKAREGEIHRLQSLSDRSVIAEVSAEGTREVPSTRFSTDSDKLFDGAPVTLTFSDPHGVVGDALIHVRFPAYPSVEEITAHVGDTVTVKDYASRGCGCASSPGAVLLALLLLCRRKR